MSPTEFGSGLIKDVTTYISSDLGGIYERAYLANQKQTAVSQPEYAPEGLRAEERVIFVRLVPRLHQHDLAIIRLYEEIIAGLQRELARYQEVVSDLLAERRLAEAETYPRGDVVRLPAEFANKMRTRAKPGLPLEGYEI